MIEDVPEAFVRDFKALAEDAEIIVLSLSRYQAWCLMATVQLAHKHPDGKRTAPVRAATMIARDLQEQIATTPALASIAEQGWT